MTWPTVAVVTTNTDAGTDIPANARPDILDGMQKLNQMIAHVSAFAATLLTGVDGAAVRTAITALGSVAPSATGLATFAGGVYTPASTPAFSTTPTFDADLSNVFELGALTANVSSMTISHPRAGQTINVRVVQDGTGGRTVAVPAGSAIAGAPSVVAGKASWLVMTYSGLASRWEGAWSQVP